MEAPLWLLLVIALVVGWFGSPGLSAHSGEKDD